MTNIGIRVTLEGVDEGKSSLVSLGDTGSASAKKVEDSFRQTSEAARQLTADLTPGQRLMAQLGVTADQVGAAMMGEASAMRTLAQAQDRVTASAVQTTAALTRMSAPAVQFRQEIEQITRLSAPAVSGFRQMEEAVVASTRMAAPAVTGFRQLVVAQEDAGKAAGVHGLQLGRLNMEAGTAAGRILGLNTALSRLTAMIGGAVAGYGPTIALLGAIVLVSAAYEKLTESTKQAEEAQKKLNDARDHYLSSLGRPAGDLGASSTADAEVAARTKAQIAALTAQRDSLNANAAPGNTAFEQSNALNNKIVELTKTYNTASNAAKATGEEVTRLTNASKQAAEQAALEVEHQNALNAAYGQNSVAIARINADYKLRSDLIRDAALYVGQEHVQMDAAAKSMHDASIAAAENAAGVGELRSKTAELNVALPALAAGMYDLQPTLMRVNSLWVDQLHNVQVLKDLYPEIAKQIRAIGDANEKVTKDQVNQAAEAIRQSQKYSDDVSKIWRDGIAKLTTDGFKSFLDFAQDLEQLFTRLMDRMAQRARELGKEAGGAGYAALAIGAAGLSGGITGYQIGQQSGNSGVGVIGGAASGAATGFAVAGPWGAVIGGLAGAVGGLLGASRAQQEAAKAMRDSVNSAKQREADFIDTGQNPILEQHHQLNAAYQSLFANLWDEWKKGEITQQEYDARYGPLHQAYLDQYAKISDDFWKGIGQQLNALNGPAGAYANQLDALHDQYVQNLASAAALHASEEDRLKITELYTKQVDALNKAFKQANVDAQNSYAIRIFNATGDSDSAYALQQQIEYQKAVDQGLDDVSLGLLHMAQQAEKEQREREKQTTLLQGQLSTAQQQLEQFKAVYDSLTNFKNSLAIGQYSPLSPRQQLDAARGQLGSLYQRALGGDVNAGNQFSGAAQSFLEASRRYNASGAGYVVDFNSVNVMTDALQKAFGSRVTDTQRQIDLLQKQIDMLNGVQQSITDLGTTLITVNDRLGTLQAALSKATVDEIVDLKESVERSGDDIVRNLEAIRSVASR
jgi:gas vesicle protein